MGRAPLYLYTTIGAYVLFLMILEHPNLREHQHLHFHLHRWGVDKYILQHLNPEDRFNVISFSTGLETFARSLRDTSEVNEAVAWVDRQSAVGSTDINRALLEAAAMADAERPGTGLQRHRQGSMQQRPH